MQAGSQNDYSHRYLKLGTEEANHQIDKLVLDQKQIESRVFYHVVKSIMDKLLSILALIVLSPVFLVISMMIKHEDGGPVFYIQRRIGKNGKPFNMYKFRSMIVNADAKIERLQEQNEVDGAMFKMREDPRITRVGKFIRKYSLDELPQLVNVIKNDISLVGPRPPLEREVKEYTAFDMQRLMVIPGCTGLWQVGARNSVGFDEMVQLDIEYIQRSGLLFDLMILFKTIYVMIIPNDAY